ncbi:MAG: VWA domain-containing protein [Spirochaetaceae bacterium]|jgi:uncharacterized protein YegL|nr:VWA domain-containing protein [Spirochaetaceae bacterium]
MSDEMFGDVQGIVRRQMVLFLLIDTSGSMEGEKIGIVNNTIREVLPELRDIGGADVDLKIAALAFSTGCKWLHTEPVSADAFQWNNMEADGVTDLGAALRELNAKMSKDMFLKAPSASVAPAIFLLSDGQPTDDYDGGLDLLRKNNWYKYAIRVALAIGGDDADKDVLAKFTGNKEAVITVHTPEALRKWIKFITVTSTQIGTKSQPLQDGQIETKQNQMTEAIQQQTDPEMLDSVSTDEGSW